MSILPISVAVPRAWSSRAVAVSASANRNSLKVTMTAKMPVAARPAPPAGRRWRSVEARSPSTASSRSTGICEEAHHPDTEVMVKAVGHDQPKPGVEELELQHQETDGDQFTGGTIRASAATVRSALEAEAQVEARMA